MGSATCAKAFGVLWDSDIPLPLFDAADHKDKVFMPAVQVRAVAALGSRAGARDVGQGHLYEDGARLGWAGEARFDLFDGAQIEYCPGPAWTGIMPKFFFGAVAALTLAWRGAIPFHATTVEIAGKALMIAGGQGAGKSTTAAALLAHGARLISDDLTIVDLTPPGRAPLARLGRPDMRLYPDIARQIEATGPHGLATDRRGKWLVRPAARCEQETIPLAAILLLGNDEPRDVLRTAVLLRTSLFRLRWLTAMPDSRTILGSVMSLPDQVAVGHVPAVRLGDGIGLADRDRLTRAAYDALIRS